jgi:hypothetical protein
VNYYGPNTLEQEVAKRSMDGQLRNTTKRDLNPVGFYRYLTEKGSIRKEVGLARYLRTPGDIGSKAYNFYGLAGRITKCADRYCNEPGNRKSTGGCKVQMNKPRKDTNEFVNRREISYSVINAEILR